MVMANVGRVPGDDRLAHDIAGTMATRFASVYMWRVERATTTSSSASATGSAARTLVGAAARRAATSCSRPRRWRVHLHAVAPSSNPLTDDKAPVEWMTDRMIIKYVSAH